MKANELFEQIHSGEIKEDTEIVTLYLPETDLQKLKAGVEIIGHTKLVEFLEDYE